jgi:hypothetical protein
MFDHATLRLCWLPQQLSNQAVKPTMLASIFALLLRKRQQKMSNLKPISQFLKCWMIYHGQLEMINIFGH